MVSPEFSNESPKSGLDAFLAPYWAISRRDKQTRGRPGHGTGEGSERLTLSIFEVPPGLLTNRDDNKYPSGISPQSNVATDVGRPFAESESIRVDSTRSGRGLTCIRCNQVFDERRAQLAHFRTDLHMTNLRRQLSGKPPVSQEEFDATNAMAGTDVSSEYLAHSNGSGEQAAAQNLNADSSEDEAAEDTAETRDSPPVGRGGADPSISKMDDDDDDDDGLVLPAVAVEELTQITTEAATAVAGTARQSRGNVEVNYSLQEGPRLTFTPSGSPWSFSLSSAALRMERGSDPWERLDSLVSDDGREAGADAKSRATTAENRLWAVVIMRSGRFAGGVFEGQAVLCHKVFRRYTIRAKRGGSQSAYDSGGRKAQSAGATLRRYGEQSLREDARALLKEWEGPLKACRVILTSVPKSMRTVLFEGKDAPFDRKDLRLRPVPFVVGKPVFEEVVALHSRVTSIVFAPAPATAAAASSTDGARKGASADSVGGAGGDGAGGIPRSGGIDVSSAGGPHQHERRPRADGGAPVGLPVVESCPPSAELLEACGRGDVEAAAAVLDRLTIRDDPAGVDGGVGVEQDGDRGPSGATAESWAVGDVINRPDGLERLMTPLHVAAAGGHAILVEELLGRGASPLSEDVRGRLPYMLAQKKETRDAFRRARAARPDAWDWDAARVPEALTDELAQRQKDKQKDKEKEKRRRAKQRKKEERTKAEEAERQRKAQEEATAQQRRVRGLAPAGCCDGCGKPVAEKKAFRRLDFRYCSTDCVQTHKRKLAADAAERRLAAAGGGGN